jgi:hypothetical protein
VGISAYGTLRKSAAKTAKGCRAPNPAISTQTYPANDLRKVSLGSRLLTESWDVREKRRHFESQIVANAGAAGERRGIFAVRTSVLQSLGGQSASTVPGNESARDDN